MAKNSMDDLRNHLFETIERLKANSDPEASPNEKMDIETAKQISQTAKVLVDSAKVEVNFLSVLSKAENRDAVINFANGSKLLPGTEQKLLK